MSAAVPPAETDTAVAGGDCAARRPLKTGSYDNTNVLHCRRSSRPLSSLWCRVRWLSRLQAWWRPRDPPAQTPLSARPLPPPLPELPPFAVNYQVPPPKPYPQLIYPPFNGDEQLISPPLDGDELYRLLGGREWGPEVPAIQSPRPKQRRRKKLRPRAPEGVGIVLKRLQADGAWTITEARNHLGDLKPLVRTEHIRIIETVLGRCVVLNRAGQLETGQEAERYFSVSPLVDRLYLRLAAEHFGWRIVKPRSNLRRHRRIVLEQVAVVQRGQKRHRILASCISGGYAPETVRRMHQRLLSTVLYEGAPLIVVTPDARRLRYLKNLIFLEIVEFRLPVGKEKR